MNVEAKILSECGPKYVLDDKPGEGYEVEIDPGEHLVVEFGAVVGKPAAKFAHPNVAATAKQLYHFRTYFKSGAKRWYAKAGVSYWFVIPRSAVKLLPEKGYSYVKAEINGVKVGFNVTGGGGSGMWTDWLRTSTQVSVNHPLKDLKKIAEVAVRGTAMEPVAVKGLEPGDEAHWAQLAAKSDRSVKEQVVELVKAGKNPVVKLVSGYQYSEGKAVDVVRRYVKTRTGENEWQWGETGPLKALVLDVDGHWGKLRAKVSQIDWAATAKANGIAA